MHLHCLIIFDLALNLDELRLILRRLHHLLLRGGGVLLELVVQAWLAHRQDVLIRNVTVKQILRFFIHKLLLRAQHF